ncbi:MAG: sugar nucleotide-binding protein [Flavobacteriaceae bacterium]|nr:sugar nucleotide-binding protein [Flavobacteriaceae bacterium]
MSTAAMTNVDLCERKRTDCDLINVKVVENLIICCKKAGIHLIHISTDFIFDGLKGYYKEEDTPNPVNHYGLSKWRSEELITKSKIEATILRTILVYGITEDLKSNIILWVKNNLENKKDINVVTDQWRMPTHVDDLADACIHAFEKEVKGVFNVSSNQLLSIYEIALLVADKFYLDKKYIRIYIGINCRQSVRLKPDSIYRSR